MGGSRPYRSDLGEDGVRTDEVQDRTCECPHLGGRDGMGTNEERIKERESINQIKEGSPELRRLKSHGRKISRGKRATRTHSRRGVKQDKVREENFALSIHQELLWTVISPEH